MSEPEPSPDLRENVFRPFPVSQLVEDDDLVFPELIAIVVDCHNVSPFLVDALRVSPETKKAQPITMDRLGMVVVCGGNATACLMILCGVSHLLSFSWI